MHASKPDSISVDDFAEATFKAVMRAAEARKLEPGDDRQKLILGPIIYGIIWWPEGFPGEGPIIAPPVER
jgi:hypothetical protein